MSEKLPKNPEKRHYQRLDEELPVRLEIDGRLIESTLHNISCGGMFLPHVQIDIPKDSELKAQIALPQTSEATAKTVKLSGRIVRVNPNINHQDSALAVEFNGLYDENHLEIDRYIKLKLIN